YNIPAQEAADGMWWQTPYYSTAGLQSPLHFKKNGQELAEFPVITIIVKQPIKIVPPAGTVTRFDKYEAEIVLDEDYFHHSGDGTKGLKQKDRFDAYDADANGEKIIVDARFRLMTSADNSATVVNKDGKDQVYNVPCFAMKDGADALFKWKVRFAPPYETIGTQVWELTARAAVWHVAKHDTPNNYDEFNQGGNASAYFHYYGYNDDKDEPRFPSVGNQHKDAKKFFRQASGPDGKTYDEGLPKPRVLFTCAVGTSAGRLQTKSNDVYFSRAKAGVLSTATIDERFEPVLLVGAARTWSINRPAGSYWGSEYADLESEIFQPSHDFNCNVVNVWNASWFTNISHMEQKERWPNNIKDVPTAEWAAWLYFDQARANRLDGIFTLSETYNQIIIFSLFAPVDLRDQSGAHDWGKGHYGKAADPNEIELGIGFSDVSINVSNFFKHAPVSENGKTVDMGAAFKNYLRYYIARWGYHRNLGLFQPLTEWDGAGQRYNDQDVISWTEWVFALLRDKKFNPYSWPISISRPWIEQRSTGFPNDSTDTAILAGAESQQVSYVNHHGYFQDINNHPDLVAEPGSYDLISQHIAKWERKVRSNGAVGGLPLVCGEFGLKEKGTATDGYDSVYGKKRYPTYVHYGLWAGLCAGYAATPMKWSDGKEFGEMRARPPSADGFTATKFPYNLWLEYQAVSVFVSAAPKPDLAVLRRNATAACSNSQVQVICLSEANSAIGFVYNAALEFEANGNLKPCTRTGTISIPGMGTGGYEVCWYNTWTGQAIGGGWQAVNNAGGTISFALPSFAESRSKQPAGTFVRDANDIAFKLRKQ
ncbi:MAG: hypothetical protein V1754_08540, partial [Pseudomonadota bacterium]